MIDLIKFKVWPVVKVKTLYWWWIIKYGGKKNIPPEVVLGSMEKAMKDVLSSVEQAFRLVDSDASPEEKEIAAATFAKVQELQDEVARLTKTPGDSRE